MLLPIVTDRVGYDKVFILAQNTAGEQISGGVFVAWDFRNASSLGKAVTKLVTSGVTLFAGIVAGKINNADEANTDIATNAFGLIQAWGLNASVAHNMGLASVSAAGQWLLPWAASYSGQSYRFSGGTGTWTSEALTVARGAFIMDTTVSGSGWCRAFVRAL